MAEFPQLSTVPHAEMCQCEVWERWDAFCRGGVWNPSAGTASWQPAQCRPRADTAFAEREHSCVAVWLRAECASQERLPLKWAPSRSSSLPALTSLSVTCPCLTGHTAEIKHHKAQIQWQRDRRNLASFTSRGGRRKWGISEDLLFWPFLLPDFHGSFLFKSGFSENWNSPGTLAEAEKIGEWAVAVMIFQQWQITSSRDKSKKIGRNALTHSKNIQIVSILLDISLENSVWQQVKKVGTKTRLALSLRPESSWKIGKMSRRRALIYCFTGLNVLAWLWLQACATPWPLKMYVHYSAASLTHCVYWLL